MHLFKHFEANNMTESSTRPELPDRLSIDARSPHYLQAIFQHAIGFRFNDKERLDVVEDGISDGWIKVPGTLIQPSLMQYSSTS